jgi:hypothetical protein
MREQKHCNILLIFNFVLNLFIAEFQIILHQALGHNSQNRFEQKKPGEETTGFRKSFKMSQIKSIPPLATGNF